MTLARFGVSATDAYLLDTVARRIVAEGDIAPLKAKAAEWNALAGERYRVVTDDDAEDYLMDWGRFCARNEYMEVRA